MHDSAAKFGVRAIPSESVPHVRKKQQKCENLDVPFVGMSCSYCDLIVQLQHYLIKAANVWLRKGCIHQIFLL